MARRRYIVKITQDQINEPGSAKCNLQKKPKKVKLTGSWPLENIPKKQPGMNAYLVLQDTLTVKNGSYLNEHFIYQEVNSIAINQNWRTAGAGQDQRFSDSLPGKSKPGRFYSGKFMGLGLLSRLLILINLSRIGLNEKNDTKFFKNDTKFIFKTIRSFPRERHKKRYEVYFQNDTIYTVVFPIRKNKPSLRDKPIHEDTL